MANLLTGCRMLCGILMLCFPAFSTGFTALYLLGGLTDMLDGTVARKTHTASRLGARLDTAADFIFAAAALAKLWPVLSPPTWLWIWTAVVAGFLLFLFPLSWYLMDVRHSAAIVCAVATFAAVQEGHYIRTGRDIE